MIGPCRASPTHSSLGCDASKRPKATLELASSERVRPIRRKWRCKVRSFGAHPHASPRMWPTWAAVRSGASRLSASAMSSICVGTFNDSARGLGLRASNPPARHARIHWSAVDRPTRTSTPPGPTWMPSANWRTRRPRWRVDSVGSAASRINA